MIRSITGLRFIAAFAVVLLHSQAGILAVFPAWAPLVSLLHAGNVAVDLFFVLSGFVLTIGYGATFVRIDARAWLRFLWRRIARIYPLHLMITLGIALGLLVTALRGDPLAEPDRYTLPSLVANLLLVHAWGTDRLLTWNEVSWSISAEWFAYLCFPLVALVTARVRHPGALVLIGFGAIAAEIVVMVVWLDTPLVRVSGSFTLGVCLARAFAAGWRRDWPWDRIAFGVSVACVVLLAALPPDGSQSLVTPLFGVVILAIAHQRGALASALSRPRMVFLGDASYALYLVHGVVGPWLVWPQVIRDAPWILRAALLAMDLTTIVAVAALIYALFDRPVGRYLGALASPAQASRRSVSPSQSQ